MGDNELPYVLAVAHVVVPAVRLEFLHLLFGDPDVDRLRQISSCFSSHGDALLNFIEIVMLSILATSYRHRRPKLRTYGGIIKVLKDMKCSALMNKTHFPHQFSTQMDPSTPPDTVILSSICKVLLDPALHAVFMLSEFIQNVL